MSRRLKALAGRQAGGTDALKGWLLAYSAPPCCFICALQRGRPHTPLPKSSMVFGSLYFQPRR